jgi:hypothetical protein
MIKKLLNLLRSPPKEEENPPPVRTFSHPKVPNWQTEIIEHPQYWVESNYTCVDKLPPVVVRFAKKELKDGLIANIPDQAVNDAALLIRDTIVQQLKENFTVDEGLWSLQFHQETTTLQVRMHPTEKRYWDLAQRLWSHTNELFKNHGITVPEVKESWDEKHLRIELMISLKQIRFAMDSPIFWTVLHRNKGKIIVWNNKVWMPK